MTFKWSDYGAVSHLSAAKKQVWLKSWPWTVRDWLEVELKGKCVMPYQTYFAANIIRDPSVQGQSSRKSALPRRSISVSNSPFKDLHFHMCVSSINSNCIGGTLQATSVKASGLNVCLQEHRRLPHHSSQSHWLLALLRPWQDLSLSRCHCMGARPHPRPGPPNSPTNGHSLDLYFVSLSHLWGRSGNL